MEKKESPETTVEKKQSKLKLPKTQEVVAKKEIGATLCEKFNVSRKTATEIIDTVLDEIKTSIIKKKVVKFVGFGKMSLVVRKERKARNPITGEVFMVDEHYAVKFVPGNEFKTLAAAVSKPKSKPEVK